MSIKYKIALLFAALVTIILSLVSLSIYFFSVKERQDVFSTRLKYRALTSAKMYAGMPDRNFSLLQQMDAAAVTALFSKSVSIIDDNNSHEYMFADKPGDSLYLTKKIIERTKKDGEHFFAYNNQKAVAVYYPDSIASFIVAVAAVDIDGQQYLQQLKRILIISLMLAVTLSYFAGLVFATNLILPIARITGEVNLITSNNLSQRIEISNNRDELTKLALTFNSLLDRLQESFAIQRRFISNASHELSTPLTSISSQLEVALQKDRTTGEYKEVCQSVQEDIKELQQLTRSLLDIAKAGSQGGIDLSEIRLDEVLFKVAADVQRQNVSFNVLLNFQVFPDDENLLTVFGNGNLLYMALKNIIENGCKYSDNNESSITASFNKTSILVKVANKGDVIAESDIQNIFQPFFRTEAVQHKPGFGLGLTLAKRILSLHKGSISVESNPQSGTVFTIELPNILSS